MAHRSLLTRLENFLTEWPRSERERASKGAHAGPVGSQETPARPEVPIH